MDPRRMALRRLLLTAMYLLLTDVVLGSKDVLKFSLPRDEVTVYLDDSLFATCMPPREASVSRIMWISPKNDVIQDHGRIHVEQSNEVNGLDIIFQNIQHSDKGLYTCGANVDGEEVSRTLKVLVLKPITFIDTPSAQSAPEFSNYVIRCHVEGDPEPTLTIKSVSHDRSQKNRYNRTEDGLLIRNITRSDTGEYRCTALQISARRTAIKEMNIYFAVKYIPEWTTAKPDNFFSYFTGSANLTCEAIGEPMPDFKWYRNDQLIVSETGGYFLYNTTDGKSVLKVIVYNESDLGNYECEAYNEMGFIRRSVTVLKGEKPQVPYVQVKRYRQSSIELDIRASSAEAEGEEEGRNNEFKLIGYRVEFKTDEQEWDQAARIDFIPGETYIIRDLEADKSYSVRVAAKSIAGYGDFCEDVRPRTLRFGRLGDSDRGATLARSQLLLFVTTICACLITFILV